MYIYEKIREIWKNKPDKSTPILAEDIMHIEDGIHKNSFNCIELLDELKALDKRVKKLEGGGGGDVDIVSWSEGTDAQIAAMAEALRNGTISVEDTDWEVGQERTVQLSAIESANFGNHAEQTQTLVLLHKGGKLLDNGKECNFVVGLKNCLADGTTLEGFGMNASDINEGGWDKSRMRTGCNEEFINMLPEDLRPAFVKFQNITADGTGDTTKTSIDLFALPAEKEVFGKNSYANSTAEADLFQFDYYADSNRIKKAGDNGSSSYWWGRSPRSSDSAQFCLVYTNGSASSGSASSTHGLAPFGCI